MTHFQIRQRPTGMGRQGKAKISSSIDASTCKTQPQLSSRSVLPHFGDLRLERRIKRLGNACADAINSGDKATAALLWKDMCEAIAKRSAGQIRRMEDGLWARICRQLKRATFVAFCHGWIPAFVVAAAYRALQLGGV